VVVAILAVAVVAVMARPHPAPSEHPCCKPPPNTIAVRKVPPQWRTAAAHRNTEAAWDLLTPEAQRRYGSVGALRVALAGLAPHPRGPATWHLVDQITQGGGTPSEFLYMLIENKSLRPVCAIVVHSMANGSHDGRVDPEVATTTKILEPAPHATVSAQPRIRTATGSPPDYVAVQAGGQILGAVGAIRDGNGVDAPFEEALKPGPALIIAVDFDGKTHFAYGSVRVTVR
jgi:hypothetical protein